MSCVHCGENRFSNAAQLECHISKNHAEFSCGCNKKFMDVKSLEQHKKDKLKNAKKITCSKCCRSFGNINDLYQHKRSTNHWTTGERTKAQEETGHVFCDDRCGRSFKTASAYEDHKRDILAKYGISDKTCRGCEKSFSTKERLNQHKKDTGHSKKETSRAMEYLDNFHKKYIALSKADKKASVGIVEKTVRDMMDHVKKSDGGDIYCLNILKAGSYPTKTKIGIADEFDLNVVCKIPLAQVRTRGEINYAYDPLDEKKGLSSNMNVPMELKDVPNGKTILMGYAAAAVRPGTVPAHLTYNGHIIPREFKQDLYKKFNTAIEKLGFENVYLNRNAHGPALTLTICGKGGFHDINVDVSISVPCNVPITDNGWPRPATRKAFSSADIEAVKKTGMHLVPKGDELWAVSCSKAEKALLSKIDRGNGCRRSVNKIQKKMTQDCKSSSHDGLPGISSHIMKHQILWSAEKNADPTYWQHENLKDCFIDTTGDLAKALFVGKLPNYFNTAENILKGKDRDVMRRLGQHMMNERVKLLHI